MKKLIVSFVMASLLSGSYLFCSHAKGIEKRVSVGIHSDYEIYVKQEQQPDGSWRRINGMPSGDKIIPLACVTRSEDRINESYNDNNGRKSDLYPEVSDDKLKFTQNMTIDAPVSSDEYSERKKAKMMKQQAIKALTADSDDDSI